MTNDENDTNTWSKSKKKRMRKLKKAEATKKLLKGAGESGSKDGMEEEGKAICYANKSPTKRSTSDNAIGDGKRNATSPIKPPMLNGINGDGRGNRNKRRRKNPVASSPAAAKRDKSSGNNQMVSIRSNPKKKTKEAKNTSSSPDENDTQKSPSKSRQNNAEESPLKSSAANQAVPNSIIGPKTRKKKKKNLTKTTASPSEESQVAPSKPNQVKSETVKGNDASSNSNVTVKLQKGDSPKLKITLPKPSQMSTLQRTFLERLTSSRFRELNEQLYTHSSQHSFENFTKNPELFDQYHVGFRKQAQQWPVNPIDVIYEKILRDYSSKKKNEKEDEKCNTKDVKQEREELEQVVIADFGCGDAKLAERLLSLRLGNDGHTLAQVAPRVKKSKDKQKEQLSSSIYGCPFKVFSFDLVSGGNPLVMPADMSDVPLAGESVDVGVYSLALMGTNVADFVREAWRVLKFSGVLRVAEVRSRFEAATMGGADEEVKRDDKQGKLKNGKKHPKKISYTNGCSFLCGGCDNNNNPPRPLMLLNEFLLFMDRCGFRCMGMDRTTNKMFLFMEFMKVNRSRGLSGTEHFAAKPCKYKRR